MQDPVLRTQCDPVGITVNSVVGLLNSIRYLIVNIKSNSGKLWAFLGESACGIGISNTYPWMVLNYLTTYLI